MALSACPDCAECAECERRGGRRCRPESARTLRGGEDIQSIPKMIGLATLAGIAQREPRHAATDESQQHCWDSPNSYRLPVISFFDITAGHHHPRMADSVCSGPGSSSTPGSRSQVLQHSCGAVWPHRRCASRVRAVVDHPGEVAAVPAGPARARRGRDDGNVIHAAIEDEFGIKR
jgi:hypothetical protein